MSNRILTELEKVRIDAYLKEYSECAASYRHTYATIWQAGGIFFATSGVMLAFSDDINNIVFSFSLVPIVFWWIGLFLPMDKYGEMRSKRLSDIEEELNNLKLGLKMRHFSRYEQGRKNRNEFESNEKYKVRYYWRVKTIVNLFMISIFFLQALLAINYVSRHF